MKRLLLSAGIAVALLPAAASASGEPVQCRTVHSGVVNTAFYNGTANSIRKHVRFPVSCPDAVVIAQTQKQNSVLCGNGSGPTVCPNDPATTSQDIHASVFNVTSEGFDVIASTNNGVWVGAVSPAFPIGWQAVCGDRSLPVCPARNVAGGVARTQYFNGKADSVIQTVQLPASCANPVVTAQSYTDSLLCGNGQGATGCPNNIAKTVTVTGQPTFIPSDGGGIHPWLDDILGKNHDDGYWSPGKTSVQTVYTNTSIDVHAAVTGIADGAFKMFLTAMDNVWVGNPSPNLRMGYNVMCGNEITQNPRKVHAGTEGIVFFNGKANSVVKHVRFPQPCRNAAVNAQSYVDGLKCGNGSGPTVCPNDPGTTSQDIQASVVKVTDEGFDLLLSGNNGVWVGAVSPQFPVAWIATCDADPVTPPQCSDGVDNDGDGRADFFDPGCYPSGVFNSVDYNPQDTNEGDDAQFGCIEITKEAYTPQHQPISPVPPFRFTLDGRSPRMSNALGKLVYQNIVAGTHAVAETVPAGWVQTGVFPAGGTVTVQPGTQCAQVRFQNRQL